MKLHINSAPSGSSSSVGYPEFTAHEVSKKPRRPAESIRNGQHGGVGGQRDPEQLVWLTVIGIAMLSWSALLFEHARGYYHEFRFPRYDLGNMVQAVWSTAEGRPLETTLGSGEQMTRLAVHVDPILVLLAPLWIVAPSPLTLAAAQIGACALGALPVFWLARKHLASERAGGLLALAYLAYPWLAFTATDSIHPVTFAIPLGLYCIWYLDTGRFAAFAVFAVLLAATGEIMGLAIAGLGIWVAVSGGKRRAGAMIAATGLAWTVVCVTVIIPRFGAESPFSAYYSELGHTPGALLRNAFTEPIAVLAALGTAADLRYVVLLGAPLGMAFVLSPVLAAAAAPQLLANTLSTLPAHVDPRQHVIAGAIPFLIAAAIVGIARIPRRLRTYAAAAVLLLSIVSSIVWFPWPGVHGEPLQIPGQRFESIYGWYYGKPPRQHIEALRAAVRMIPDGASVASTNKVGSHLSARRRYFSVPHVQDADWVVIDLDDPWIPMPEEGQPRRMWGSFNPRVLNSLSRQLKLSREWRTVLVAHDVYVFQRIEQQ
jgi:uncharacterized membrane protein